MLLYKEVLTPFYGFQAFAVVLFYFENYYYYAACIFVLSLVSAATSLFETRRNLISLRRIASLQCSVNLVLPPFDLGTWEQGVDVPTARVDASILVPGDIIEVLAEGTVFPCDAVILSGICLCNESMLTGWSYAIFFSIDRIVFYCIFFMYFFPALIPPVFPRHIARVYHNSSNVSAFSCHPAPSFNINRN